MISRWYGFVKMFSTAPKTGGKIKNFVEVEERVVERVVVMGWVDGEDGRPRRRRCFGRMINWEA